MKIAYLIMGHQNPKQIKRLVRALSGEGTSFFIHFNKKTDRKDPHLYQELTDLLASEKNVFFIPRQVVYWGQFGLLKATLEGLKMLAKSRVEFDYVNLLSGQDYPIKSVAEIEDFFAINNGKQFIQYYPVDVYNPWTDKPVPWNAKKRLEYSTVAFRTLEFHIPSRRRLPFGYVPYVGYTWWSFSKEFIEYLIGFIENHSGFVNHFKYTFASDELFFQCVLLNSPFRSSVVNNDLRFVDWENPNPGIPRTFVQEDFERIACHSGLFARKFDAERDAAILDLIDQKILYKEPGAPKFKQRRSLLLSKV